MGIFNYSQFKLYGPSILARVSVTSLLLCIGYITYQLPRWNLFTLHPTMLTLSFVFSTLAILQLQEPSGVRLTRTTFHIIYQLLALVCLIMGIGVFFVPKPHQKTKFTKHKHRISLHALTGYIFFYGTFPILIYGFIVRRPPKKLKPWLPKTLQMRSQHRLLGFLAHLALSTSLGLGLMKHWVTRSTIPNYILTVSLGLAVISAFLRVNVRKLIRGLFKRKRSQYQPIPTLDSDDIESTPLIEPEQNNSNIISQDETDTHSLLIEPDDASETFSDHSLDSPPATKNTDSTIFLNGHQDPNRI